MSLTRSLIRTGVRSEFPSGASFAARLLRVLDLLDISFYTSPTEIFELVTVWFLRVRCLARIPTGISRLWNLQTLICYCEFDEPPELLQLSEFRNLDGLIEIELLKDEEMNYSVREKLQRISLNLRNQEATTWDGFLKSIPNIKELSIHDGFRTTSTAIDLSHLHKLKRLRCCFIRTTSSPDVCALHKLEVLGIKFCIFKSEEKTCDDEWELADGDVFYSVWHLSLHGLSLVHWIADETNFLRLRHLYVKDI
ncbi:hypothetical protein SASPL_147038 [Salvia splendens]|uniref:Disease resistance protein RPM1 n=1 Tax=Salvia splendens TaxID=180675 RepID=A0A8X8WDS2_SALSN|nr:hypothetical protein SASPL_147038 [Salvia splendens]